jgi:hypothetical protein
MNVVPLGAVHFRDLLVQFHTIHITKVASELLDGSHSNAINVDIIHFMCTHIT